MAARDDAWGEYRDGPDYAPTDRYPVRPVFDAGWDAAASIVREIHGPVDAIDYGVRNPRQTRVCAGCGTDGGNWQFWPCPTLRALGVVS
jgi:hypothetical protein